MQLNAKAIPTSGNETKINESNIRQTMFEKSRLCSRRSLSNVNLIVHECNSCQPSADDFRIRNNSWTMSKTQLETFS